MLSMLSFRFSRRTPPAMSTPSASAVEQRSSSNTTGSGVFPASSAAKRRVFSVCADSVPSAFSGSPQTISPAPFSSAMRSERPRVRRGVLRAPIGLPGQRERVERVARGDAYPFIAYIERDYSLFHALPRKIETLFSISIPQPRPAVHRF